MVLLCTIVYTTIDIFQSGSSAGPIRAASVPAFLPPFLSLSLSLCVSLSEKCPHRNLRKLDVEECFKCHRDR